MKDNQHWTEAHIVQSSEGWVAYDETGSSVGTYATKDDARDALVIYDAVVLGNKIQKCS